MLNIYEIILLNLNNILFLKEFNSIKNLLY